MSGNKVLTNLIILVVVISAIFIGYRFFFASSGSAELAGLAPAGVAQVNQAGTDEFLGLLLSLQEINLSKMPQVLAVLSGLEDFSTELEDKEPGRNNPFAPIGVGGRPDNFSSSSTNSVSSSTNPTVE